MHLKELNDEEKLEMLGLSTTMPAKALTRIETPKGKF